MAASKTFLSDALDFAMSVSFAAHSVIGLDLLAIQANANFRRLGPAVIALLVIYACVVAINLQQDILVFEIESQLR